MSKGTVTIERRGHVLMMGLDRVKKRNAFDLAMYHALALAYGDFQRDETLRCGVLFAHGEHFTGGLDRESGWRARMKRNKRMESKDEEKLKDGEQG